MSSVDDDTSQDWLCLTFLLLLIPLTILFLLNRLGDWFGLTGKAVDWFQLYLIETCQMIKLGDFPSLKVHLPFGIPQGSQGSLLFNLYTTPPNRIISAYAIPHHVYADESQVHVSSGSSDSTAILKRLHLFLTSVQSWMFMNKIKLNPDKTEFLLIGNEQHGNKYLALFRVFGVETDPTKSVENLRVIF